MTDIFNSLDYRTFLRSWLEEPSRSRGIMGLMAKELGCQNSHLSRVVRSEVHLTPDQAYATCLFMKFTETETVYFLKMVERDRSATPKYKLRLTSELKALKRSHENLAMRFSDEQIGNFEIEMTYYSAWFWSAIHILTAIPAYHSSKAIADRLGLSELAVRNCLHSLESFGLVTRRNETWTTSSYGSTHLPKSSPMNSIQHGNWRSRAVLNSQDPSAEGLHYTVVQSVSRDDFDKIKRILLKSIDRYREIADPSVPEEAICFTCDLFRI